VPTKLGAKTVENVVNFPAKSVRDWLIIERGIKEELEIQNIPLDVRTRIIDGMKSLHEICDFPSDFQISVAFPNKLSQAEITSICSDIGEKVGAIFSERLQALTERIRVERVHREMNICRELGLL
jgi:hypothetical protein